MGKKIKNRVISQTDNSITFYIDGDLPQKNDYLSLDDAETIERMIFGKRYDSKAQNSVIYSSFRKTSLYYPGEDILFKCFVEAYAEHHPLVLSPDMIWLIICQGFSHYINNYAEKYRNIFVNHSGKMDLVVETGYEILSEEVDWTKILNGFSDEISKNSKGAIIENLVANFSTTGDVERIASQITVMDIVKEYFNFIVIYTICGIPYITIEGTTEDWKSILERLTYLRQFDLDWWIDRLEPIIQEFVSATNGSINGKFWKNIVKKRTPETMIGTGCIPDFKPTMLDGWFLNFFPFNKDGRTPSKVPCDTDDMLSEIVKVDFKYIKTQPDGSNQTFPMQLYSGFVGIDVDSVTSALRPKIGWLVKQKEEDLFRTFDTDCIELRVNKVPEALRNIPHINNLRLYFTGRIELPDWMDSMQIDWIDVIGEITNEEKKELRKRFKNISIN